MHLNSPSHTTRGPPGPRMRKPLVLVLLVALLTLQYLVAFVNFEFWWNDTVIAWSLVATLAIGLIEAR